MSTTSRWQHESLYMARRRQGNTHTAKLTTPRAVELVGAQGEAVPVHLLIQPLQQWALKSHCVINEKGVRLDYGLGSFCVNRLVSLSIVMKKSPLPPSLLCLLFFFSFFFFLACFPCVRLVACATLVLSDQNHKRRAEEDGAQSPFSFFFFSFLFFFFFAIEKISACNF